MPVGPALLASGAEAPGSWNHLPAADSCLLCPLGGVGGGAGDGRAGAEGGEAGTSLVCASQHASQRP